VTRDELARAIVKLPGFDAERQGMMIKFTDADSGGSAWEITVCDDTAKAVHEIVTESTYDGKPITEWWPDLTDAATGGCLLELLGVEGWRVQRCRARLSFDPEDMPDLYAADDPLILPMVDPKTWRAVTDGPLSRECPSLAEACARVALALGRWPGDGS
jgi:hypothetical protein